MQRQSCWSWQWSGVVALQQIDANITLKTGRQLFAKVPGVFVYDMDGSGNQVNIATRSSMRTAAGSTILGITALSPT
ncbi:MAG: hypothetical protein ACK5OP_13005 [Sphingobacteriales bacterium]